MGSRDQALQSGRGRVMRWFISMASPVTSFLCVHARARVEKRVWCFRWSWNWQLCLPRPSILYSWVGGFGLGSSRGYRGSYFQYLPVKSHMFLSLSCHRRRFLWGFFSLSSVSHGFSPFYAVHLCNLCRRVLCIFFFFFITFLFLTETKSHD